jgi:hypothetical protein
MLHWGEKDSSKSSILRDIVVCAINGEMRGANESRSVPNHNRQEEYGIHALFTERKNIHIVADGH